jgi:tryptophanase
MSATSQPRPRYRPLRGSTHNVAERARRLAGAAYNLWRLEPEDVELDLFTDVPHWSFVDAEPTGRRSDLSAPIEAVFGAQGAVATQCGRAAEYVLASSLARRAAPGRFTVVSHGSFITTERAFRIAGATVEPMPRARDGASDPDLGWLADRLRRGGVDVVCLEPSNGALAGWPIDPGAAAAAGELARGAGAVLVLDATRVLSNASALGLPVLDTAQQVCRAADAFTVSCSKELLVAGGGLVAARDPALRRDCFELAWTLGLHLEPLRAQAELADGLAIVRGDPALFDRRRCQVGELAARLHQRGLPVIEPVAGYAVFVRTDALVGRGREHRAIALEAALYERSGIRARILQLPLLATCALRLTWPLGARPDAADLDAVAEAVDGLFRADAVPDVRPDPSYAGLPLFRTFERIVD